MLCWTKSQLFRFGSCARHVGLVYRRVHAGRLPSDSPRQQLIDQYSIATLHCVMQLEWHLRRNLPPKEVASITLEYNGDLQKRIGEVFLHVTSERVLAELDCDVQSSASELLPITRVIDEPSYQTKTSASLLQLADFCAFAFKRAGRQLDHERFAKPLDPAALRWGTRGEARILGPVW